MSHFGRGIEQSGYLLLNHSTLLFENKTLTLSPDVKVKLRFFGFKDEKRNPRALMQKLLLLCYILIIFFRSIVATPTVKCLSAD